jgi:alpha-L-fucosidase 2
MKSFFPYYLIIFFACQALAQDFQGGENQFVAGNDVTWNFLGTNENDSMPVGNGDVAANVWTEQNGDLVLLVAKADAWAGTGALLKLGRVRVRLNPNPFAGAASFTQVLKLESGSIELKSGENTLRVWIDANHPVIHTEARLEHPGTFQATLELWRKTDKVLSAGADRVTWCHFNSTSMYPSSLKQEHLESLIPKYPDPLLHRCFGATLAGPGLVSSDDHTLKSTAPGQDFRLDVIALTQQQVDSVQVWQSDLDALIKEVDAADLQPTWAAHQQWWQYFWSRSWIHVAGTPEAAKVSQGYVMQRYMMACSSRGEQPAKFNGGLFTVGHDLLAGAKTTEVDHTSDYRRWDECYWNQNNRLLYWPLIATGDNDLLKPWFEMYLKALPLARDRTQLYYHHDGASFPETMYFWGLPKLGDFGANNPSNEIQSHWQRYHIQGTLEVIAQMLDYCEYTGDIDFARHSIVPFADAIVTYYDQHWPRNAGGKIRMSPVQSLETYQLDAVNPTPDIAGLKADLSRLLALPNELTSDKQRTAWAKTLEDLPPVPMGKTAHGILPPFGLGDTNGTPTILPAEKYGKTSNGENPELYVAFPYRLYGVGKPGLKLAQDTFAARLFHQDTCWGQDGTQAAVLGLTTVAQKAAIDEFTDYGDERFPWFWKARNDWIPDLDNGGSGMITLQLMLMQCDGQRIQLLPAWPTNWTADFKLHAPDQTTVEGHVENGNVTRLKVIPSDRAKDVTVVRPKLN